MRGRWELTDEQWAMIEPVLRPARRSDNRGRPWHDTRAVLDGVLWVLGTGAQWRELPGKYPPFQTCHRRFQQWVRTGKLERALTLLTRHLHERGQLNLDEAFLDATFASAKKGALPLAHAARQGHDFGAFEKLPTRAHEKLPICSVIKSRTKRCLNGAVMMSHHARRSEEALLHLPLLVPSR